MSKYRNVKTELDGHTFDSKAEARRYADLKLLEHSGLIGDLELQPRFDLVVTGVETVRIGAYVADFRYVDRQTGETITEDVKGKKTRVYSIKKKLVRALHGVEVVEISS